MIITIYILSFIGLIYSCSIGFSIIGFLKQKKKKILDDTDFEKKQISVVIAARNEANNIIECLNSLLIQNYNKNDFEIIVIDDNSTDNTSSLVKQFIKLADIDVKLYSLDNKTSKKEALKLGVQKSKYSVIATTDADCVVPEKWLHHISNQFNNEIDMLIGPVIFKNNKGFLSAFQTLDMLAIQGLEFGTLYFKAPILNNAANLSYSKQKFTSLNGYDDYKTPSGDDVFLLKKFKSLDSVGGILSKEFIVETKAINTVKSFVNQRIRWSSKAKYYTDKILIFFSSIILIQNIGMVFIYLQLLFVEKYSYIFIILLLSKWLIDFILLFLVACFFERRKALFYFIPVQIIYPIYIVVISIMSMFVKFEWKGRKYNE